MHQRAARDREERGDGGEAGAAHTMREEPTADRGEQAERHDLKDVDLIPFLARAFVSLSMRAGLAGGARRVGATDIALPWLEESLQHA